MFIFIGLSVGGGLFRCAKKSYLISIKVIGHQVKYCRGAWLVGPFK